MMNSQDTLGPALKAVTLASRLCRSVQSKLDQVRAITKDDKSPVTIADMASQAVICKTLRDELGSVVIVGEETSAFLREAANAEYMRAALAAAREVWPGVSETSLLDAIDAGAGEPVGSGGEFWTLDPIDGTKGFLRGQQYAVSLALIRGGEPVLGVLGCPNLSMDHRASVDGPVDNGTIFWAASGGGSFEAPLPGGAGTAVEPGSERRLEKPTGAPAAPLRLCSSVEEAHTKSDTVSQVVERAGGSFVPVRLDGQGKYAVVARGQADAYLRLPTKKGYVERIWDHAAGALVAQEAGRIVTDAAGNKLDFGHGKGLERNRGIIVAHPAIHGRLTAAIREIGLLNPA